MEFHPYKKEVGKGFSLAEGGGGGRRNRFSGSFTTGT